MERVFESYLTDTEEVVLIDLSEKKIAIIFPNPLQDILYLKPIIPNLTDLHLEITTINGQVLFSKDLDLLDTVIIPIHNSPDGSLIMTIYNKLGKFVQTENWLN